MKQPLPQQLPTVSSGSSSPQLMAWRWPSGPTGARWKADWYAGSCLKTDKVCVDLRPTVQRVTIPFGKQPLGGSDGADPNPSSIAGVLLSTAGNSILSRPWMEGSCLKYLFFCNNREKTTTKSLEDPCLDTITGSQLKAVHRGTWVV